MYYIHEVNTNPFIKSTNENQININPKYQSRYLILHDQLFDYIYNLINLIFFVQKQNIFNNNKFKKTKQKNQKVSTIQTIEISKNVC